MKRAVFLLLAALVAGAAVARASSEPESTEVDATPEEQQLMDLIKARDMPVKFTIKRACPSCPRGAIATENILERYAVIIVPVDMGIRLPKMEPHGFASEYAHGLLKRIMRDPDFNTTHGLFWSTQPKPEDVLSPEMFTDELLAMVHAPRLEFLLRFQRDLGRDVYYGNATGKRYAPVHEMFPWVLWPQFAHLSAIIGTRDFALWNETAADGESENAYWLLPIADMFNHADEPNVARVENATHVSFYALRNISAGEELTYRYQPIVERNDMALFLYGFVQTRNGDLMCASDLPDYDPTNPYKTLEGDEWYYGPEGRYNTFDELNRLQSTLEHAVYQSSVEADEELLKGGKLRDWKEASIVAFRLGRKKALKGAIAAVKAELEKAAGVKLEDVDPGLAADADAAGKKDEL